MTVVAPRPSGLDARVVVADVDFTLWNGDVRDVLKALGNDTVDCCVTSPPYWGLRDYGADGQLGLEATPEEYVANLVEVFREVRRVLAPAGTLWLNLGDSYAGGGNGARDPERWPKQQRNAHGFRATHAKKGHGVKDKDLLMLPAETAIALRRDGWWLRGEIVWSKPNPMPESVTDRPTKSHEMIYLLSKSARYYYDGKAIEEPAEFYGPNGLPRKGSHTGQMRTRARRKAENSGEGLVRNKRSVWTVQTVQYADAHFATFPPDLIEPCILAGCPEGGTVLDPFFGSGTTALVARRLKRSCIGVELNAEYAAMAQKRLQTWWKSPFRPRPEPESQQSLLAEAAG